MIGKTIYESEKFSIRKLNNKAYYLIPKGLNFSYCAICGKKRKTISHHLIPRRMKCIIGIRDIMVRSCKSCEQKNHVEYKSVWSDFGEKDRLRDKIREQRMHLKSLHKKLKNLGYPEMETDEDIKEKNKVVGCAVCGKRFKKSYFDRHKCVNPHDKEGKHEEEGYKGRPVQRDEGLR